MDPFGDMGRKLEEKKLKCKNLGLNDYYSCDKDIEDIQDIENNISFDMKNMCKVVDHYTEKDYCQMKKESEGGTKGKSVNSYKSTGKKVHIIVNKRCIERTVYVNSRNTKYIVLNKEYKLLSKCKTK